MPGAPTPKPSPPATSSDGLRSCSTSPPGTWRPDASRERPPWPRGHSKQARHTGPGGSRSGLAPYADHSPRPPRAAAFRGPTGEDGQGRFSPRMAPDPRVPQGVVGQSGSLNGGRTGADLPGGTGALGRDPSTRSFVVLHGLRARARASPSGGRRLSRNGARGEGRQAVPVAPRGVRDRCTPRGASGRRGYLPGRATTGKSMSVRATELK